MCEGSGDLVLMRARLCCESGRPLGSQPAILSHVVPAVRTPQATDSFIGVLGGVYPAEILLTL